MKYCQECGAEMQDHELFCSNCGMQQTELRKADEVELADNVEIADNVEPASSFETEAPIPPVPAFSTEPPKTEFKMDYDYGQQQASEGAFYNPSAAAFPIQKYSFWKYLLLGIITCGIYQLYYLYKWTEDTNRLSQGVYKPSQNYLIVFLLSIVTCGIYYYIWTYQQGERLKVVGDANGIQINETGIHHLLLTLLLGGVGGLVSQYIFFSNTNRLSGVYNGDITREQANVKTSYIPAIIIGVVIAILAFSSFIGLMVYQARNFNYNDYSYYEDFDYEDMEDFDLEEFMNEGYADYTIDEEGLMDILFTEDGSILEITDAMVIKDVNGDPAIAVEFYWQNNSERKTSAMWNFDITAEQDGTPLTITWPKPDDPDVNMTNYSQDVDKDESTTFQLVFKLVDETTPVRVLVKDVMSGGNNKAACTFTIE
ncbi:MAG: DUF4234 domain-containing protein [Firmicutes bacterium]|nr:DUF4234 domain-containing protein [Bacillota bacterium]